MRARLLLTNSTTVVMSNASAAGPAPTVTGTVEKVWSLPNTPSVLSTALGRTLGLRVSIPWHEIKFVSWSEDDG